MDQIDILKNVIITMDWGFYAESTAVTIAVKNGDVLEVIFCVVYPRGCEISPITGEKILELYTEFKKQKSDE